MSEWRNFVSILKAPFLDRAILLTTSLLSVLVDLTVAIEIGVVMASFLFMKCMSDAAQTVQFEVDSDLLEQYHDIPKEISIYEISGPFFFASAKEYSAVIKQLGLKSKVMIIRMRHVPFIDSTGLNNLKDTIKALQNFNVKVVLSGVRKEVYADLERGGVGKLIGKENILPSFNLALERAKGLIG